VACAVPRSSASAATNDLRGLGQDDVAARGDAAFGHFPVHAGELPEAVRAPSARHTSSANVVA
jgi:hypothetical protein